MSCRVDRSDRQRGGLRSEAGQGEVDAIRAEQIAQLLAKGIARQVPKELHRDAESRHRSRSREGATPGGVRASEMSRNAVDEGLTADDDHGPISPEPRAIRRVGMTRCAVGDWSPSRRRKSSSAAAVPIAAGSWAMTVIPG